MCDRAMCFRGAFTVRSRQPSSVEPSTFPNCCLRRRRCPHGALTGDGGGDCPRSALPLSGSGAFLVGAWWQGPTSLPGSIKVYDETIRVLKSAVRSAKLGREEELQALKRLDDQARRLERTVQGPSLESFIATERTASPSLGGRSVFGWERDVANPRANGS